MSRVNNSASALGSIVLAFPVLAQNLLTVTGMAVVALLIDWKIALISLSAIPLIYYALGLYGTRIIPRLHRVQALEWQSLSIVNEAMSMLRVIVSFGREPYEFRRFREQGETAVDERVKLTVRQTAFTLGVQTSTALGSALVFGFGFAAVMRGQITIGSFIVLLSYVSSVYTPLEAISAMVGSVNQHLVQLKASMDLLDLEPEVKEAPDAKAIGRARGEVAFEHVDFAYERRNSTLEDITFSVAAGSRVAVVGPTGAGKSTLVGLVPRLYDPTAGSVRIDGHDLRELTVRSLRDQISVVPQDGMLFSGTIFENIAYGNLDGTREEIEEAARAACIHDFIVGLPEGYGTIVGERGVTLSGGQRQRLAIARALVKDAPLVLLDEPTTHLDPTSQQLVVEALERLLEGRTAIVVAHRLETIRRATEVVVLDRGQIVERGAYHEIAWVDRSRAEAVAAG
jgi:ABC-type multidrug transport system fused ATPase/permease subunit